MWVPFAGRLFGMVFGQPQLHGDDDSAHSGGNTSEQQPQHARQTSGPDESQRAQRAFEEVESLHPQQAFQPHQAQHAQQQAASEGPGSTPSRAEAATGPAAQQGPGLAAVPPSSLWGRLQDPQEPQLPQQQAPQAPQLSQLQAPQQPQLHQQQAPQKAPSSFWARPDRHQGPLLAEAATQPLGEAHALLYTWSAD